VRAELRKSKFASVELVCVVQKFANPSKHLMSLCGAELRKSKFACVRGAESRKSKQPSDEPVCMV
jgi:hypothetical protein